MDITSPAFEHHQTIPSRYTCEGENISPALIINSAIEGGVTLAILVEDPDAPHGVFTHWVAWNIPATTHEITEGKKLAFEGINDMGKIGYFGPCPPKGKPHRYILRCFSLIENWILNRAPPSPSFSKKWKVT